MKRPYQWKNLQSRKSAKRLELVAFIVLVGAGAVAIGLKSLVGAVALIIVSIGIDIAAWRMEKRDKKGDTTEP